MEWIPGEMEWWAKLNHAYTVVTGEVMDADLSEVAIEILDAAVYEGYKGWTDNISDDRSHRLIVDLVQPAELLLRGSLATD